MRAPGAGRWGSCCPQRTVMKYRPAGRSMCITGCVLSNSTVSSCSLRTVTWNKVSMVRPPWTYGAGGKVNCALGPAASVKVALSRSLLNLVQQRPEDVHRHREDDRRGALVGDLGEGLQVAKLH